MKGEMSFITIVNVWLKAGSDDGECDWKQGWKMKIYSTVFSGKGNIFYGAHQDTEQSVEGNVEVVHRSTYLSHLHTFTFNVSSATRTRYQMYPNIYNSYPETTLLLAALLLQHWVVSCCPALSVSSEDWCSGSPGWSKTDGMGCRHRRSFTHFFYIYPLSS